MYGDMFVADEARLDVSFAAALDRLASLIREGALLTVSREAYESESGPLGQAGPPRAGAGPFRLVQVQLGDLVTRGDTAGLAVRWTASGDGGEPFPTLDANLTLTPAAGNVSLLTLSGVYRPQAEPTDASQDHTLHQVATATARSFVRRLAGAIACPGRDRPPAVGGS